MQLKQIFVVRKIGISLLCVAVPALLFYGVSILVLNRSGFDIRQIIRDPATQLEVSSFLGFVSNIGVWLWISSAAISFYAVLVKRLKFAAGSIELGLLLGSMSLLLAVDDFFLLHERYVYQKGIFLFYAVCALTILVRHYRKIISIDGFSFLLAGLLLGLSVFTDMNQRKIPLTYVQVQLFEEGFKFVGAAIWLYFCAQVASVGLTSEESTARAD